MRPIRAVVSRNARVASLAVATAMLSAMGWQERASAQSGTWSAAGTAGSWSNSSNWSGGVVANGSGNAATFTTSGTTTLDSSRTIGAFSVTGAVARVIDGAGTTLTLATATGSPTISGTTGSTLSIGPVVAGTQGFRKTGTSTLILVGANTFSGPALLETGTITVASLDALGASGGGNETVVSSGAQLRLQVSGTFSESFSLAGRGNPLNQATGGGGAIRVVGSGVTITGGITLTGTAEVFPDSSSSLTVAGATSGTGGFIFRPGSGGGITVTGNMSHVGWVDRWSGGSGMLTLSGSNSYDGSTSFDNGNTTLNNPYAIPTTSRLTVTSGANVDLNGNSITIPSFGWRDDGVNPRGIFNSSGGAIFDNSATPGTSTIAVTSGSFVLGTAINDGSFGRKVALQVAGVDLSTIQMNNQFSSFSGGLTILNGPGRGTRLSLENPLVNTGSPGAITSSVLGSGTVTVGLAPTDKAQFYMGPGTYSAGVGSTVLNDFVFNTAAGTDAAAGVLLNATEAIFAGTIVSDQASASFATGSIVTNSVAVLTGRVTSTGAGGGLWLRNTGQTPGVTVRLANQTGTANDYWGTTTVEANTTLALGAADQVPNGSGKGDVDVAGSVTLGGFSETINGLSGSGFVDGVSGTPTLTVGDGDATATFSGVIGNTSGSLSLAKIGSGVQTLAGANTLSGSSVVQQGTLRLAHPAALAASTVTALSGGTVTLAPYLQTTVGGLDPNAGGLIDVGNGMITVTSGLSVANMLTAITAGYSGGTWTGTTGITSSTAAADTAGGAPRAIGWLDNGGGSVTFAFAAPGDTNLDGLIDVLDAAALSSAARFNDTAVWSEGDFNYDGIYDDLDNALFVSTGLFDAGPYNAPPGAAGAIAAVPEPGAAVVSVACLAGAAAVLRLRHRGRRRAGNARV
jgi:fibronectin-binding autotransporter adhesin